MSFEGRTLASPRNHVLGRSANWRYVANTIERSVGDAENARHEIAGHENARNTIVWNTACCICLAVHCRAGMRVDKKEHQISPPTVGAPSAGLRLPWFCVCFSLTVMTWTIISWCWLSVTNVFLTFTQVVLPVVLSIVLHWLYIHYSILFLAYLKS